MAGAGEVMLREQYDKTILNLLAYLRGMVFRMLKLRPSSIPILYQTHNTTNPREDWLLFGDLGHFERFDDEEGYPSDRWKQLWEKTFIMLQYGLSIRIGQVAAEDDVKGVFKRRGPLVGRAAWATRETHSASLLVNAFDGTNYPIPDGKALCANDHVLDAGATDDNLGAVDFGVPGLQAGLTAFKNQLTHRGEYFEPMPKTIWHGTSLEWLAREILESQLRADTQNNAINAFKEDQLQHIGWARITDDGRWFIQGDKNETEFHWFNRIMLRTTFTKDPYTDGHLFKSRMRYDHGPVDYRSFWGSNPNG